MRFLHLFVFIASLRYFRHHNRDTGAFIQLTLYGQAGIFAENINTEGIDLKGLPVGTHLRIGETEAP